MSAYGSFSKIIRNSKGLKVAHINVCSLFPKIYEIRFLLINTKIDILSISEAWLDTITDSQVKVDGYIIERNDRNRHGDGVAIYIKRDLNYTLRDDMDLDIEFSDFSMLLCYLYRPSSVSSDYYDNMLDMFDKAILENNDIVIIEDFNFNYTVDETLAINLVHYLENLYLMSKLIDTPTRVTNKSSTYIDLILITMREQHSDANVAIISLSDHYMIYTCINIKVERKQHKP